MSQTVKRIARVPKEEMTPAQRRAEYLTTIGAQPSTVVRAIKNLTERVLRRVIFSGIAVYPNRQVFNRDGTPYKDSNFCSFNPETRKYISTVVARVARFVYDNYDTIFGKDGAPHHTAVSRQTMIRASTTVLTKQTDKGERKISKVDGSRASGAPIVELALNIDGLGNLIDRINSPIPSEKKRNVIALTDSLLQAFVGNVSSCVAFQSMKSAAQGTEEKFRNTWFTVSPSVTIAMCKICMATAILNQPDLKGLAIDVDAMVDERPDGAIDANFKTRSAESAANNKLGKEPKHVLLGMEKLGRFNALRTESPSSKSLHALISGPEASVVTQKERERVVSGQFDENGDMEFDAAVIRNPGAYRNRMGELGKKFHGAKSAARQTLRNNAEVKREQRLAAVKQQLYRTDEGRPAKGTTSQTVGAASTATGYDDSNVEADMDEKYYD